MMVIFIVWVPFILLEQKTNLSLLKKLVKKFFFRGIVMSSQTNNVLKLNKYIDLDEIPYFIYADLESLIKK